MCSSVKHMQKWYGVSDSVKWSLTVHHVSCLLCDLPNTQKIQFYHNLQAEINDIIMLYEQTCQSAISKD